MPTKKKAEEEKAFTSLRVFRTFLDKCKDPKTGAEVVKADRVISKECYDLWIKTRRTKPPQPETAFQRALSCHLSGVDRRSPFKAEEESAILEVLRRKEKWPCFAESGTKFGIMGFRALGYHERKSSSSSGSTTPGDEDETSERESKSTEKRTPGGEKSVSRKRIRVQEESQIALPARSSHVIETPMEEPVHLTPTFLGGIMDASVNFTFISAVEVLKRFQLTAKDAWDKVLMMLRYVVLSRGNFVPADDNVVAEIFASVQAQFPRESIAVVDGLQRDPKDRFRVINSKGRNLIGPVTSTEGGIHRALYLRSDLFILLKVAMWAWSNAGTWQSTELNIIAWDGTVVRVVLSTLFLPAVKLCVGRAFVIDPEMRAKYGQGE